MVQYVKAKLYSRYNGTFQGNGIFLKKRNQATGGVDYLFLYRKTDTMNLSPVGDLLSSVEIDGIRFEADGNCLRCFLVSHAPAYCSFETMICGERLRTDSPFAPFQVILGDEVFTPAEMFSVNYDDLFIVERREQRASEGILIKDAYTQDNIYSGFSSYHYNRSHRSFNTPLQNDKPYRMGVELELYAKNRQAYDKITRARTNWFQCEADSSLNQHEFPIEMKTIPLRPVDATSIDFWTAPMAKLYELAVSRQYSSTGLHVHIGKEIFGATETVRKTNLKKLIWFYTYFVEDDPEAHRKNVAICGREHGYHAGDGAKTELGDFAKEIGLSVVAASPTAFRRMTDSIYNECHSERGDINIQNWDGIGTIEFRKGKGGLSRMRVAGLCTWWEQMCIYCSETPERDLNFDDFFARVMRFPAVAHFFNEEQEG